MQVRQRARQAGQARQARVQAGPRQHAQRDQLPRREGRRAASVPVAAALTCYTRYRQPRPNPPLIPVVIDYFGTIDIGILHTSTAGIRS